MGSMKVGHKLQSTHNCRRADNNLPRNVASIENDSYATLQDPNQHRNGRGRNSARSLIPASRPSMVSMIPDRPAPPSPDAVSQG